VTEHAVVIAGAGPTGLMLAGELALAGVDVAIVERRADQTVEGSRATGLHARTIEVLDQRGIAERFVAEGQTHPSVGFAHISLDLSDFPTRHNYVLALPQSRVEELLAGWVDELGAPVYRRQDVTGFTQGDGGVEVELADGEPLRAGYLVGCDGGVSVIRKAAGIEFPGWDPSVYSLLAEVEVREQPEVGIRYDENGTQAIGPAGDGQRFRVVLTERYAGQSAQPTLEDVKRALVAVWGTDFGVHSPTWISRFTDSTRQAAGYRAGRVLLAGDAAHVHYPVGGQGLQVGVQDAVNLGWKLAQVVHGTAPDTLLDTYQAERHPVAAAVLQNTMAQTAIIRSDPRIDALRGILSGLLAMDEPRRRLAGAVSGLDIRYDLGDGHPLLGRRMPDLDLETPDGPRRLFSLLHEATPVLLDFGGSGLPEGVRVIEAGYAGSWELPVVGTVAAPGAVLVRPDGHVGWVGDLAG
jgi:3-(3-hydroxy-phenyl)propionate hydroxylase